MKGRGRRISSLKGIVRLSRLRRAVWYANYRRPVSAAFVMSMQARVVAQMIDIGLYEYRKGAE